MKSPVRRVKYYTVEVTSGQLRVTFNFNRLLEASAFIDALKVSPSVDGMSLFDSSGKFMGAQDGGS